MANFDFSKVTFLKFSCSKFETLRAIKEEDKNKVVTEAKKDKVKVKKHILESPELEYIVKFYSSMREWIRFRSCDSPLGPGVYVVLNTNIERINEKIAEARAALPEYVAAFVESYPRAVEDARPELGNLWNERDYPPVESIASYFSINKQWISTGIPENLPETERQSQQREMEIMWREQSEVVNNALCLGFQKVISHAIEQITKKKNGNGRLSESNLDEVKEFIATFKDRNIFDNQKLAELVSKAERILGGVDADTLRVDVKLNGGLSDSIARQFNEVNESLSGMIVDRPTRKIRF